MSVESKHIIQRQIFQVHLDKEEYHHELTEEIKRVFNTQIVPRLSKTFDEIAKGRTIRIDKLDIRLPKMNLTDWKEKFPVLLIQEIKREIELQLSEMIEAENKQQPIGRHSASGSKVKTEINTVDAFLFFCQKGCFPWWFQFADFEKFEKDILDIRINILINSINKISSKPQELERLAEQFSDDFFVAYFNKIQKRNNFKSENKLWINILSQAEFININSNKWRKLVLKSTLISKSILTISERENKISNQLLINKIIQFIQKETRQDKIDIALQIFKTLKLKKGSEANQLIKEMEQFIEGETKKSNLENDHVLPQNNINTNNLLTIFQKETEGETEQQDMSDADLSKDIHYIKNAGIVIVWPFLSRFFESLNLTSGKSFKNEESQIKAILILQYLVDGKTHWNENELLINKIICGFPFWKTIPTDLRLTPEIKEQSESLFSSIIEYWKRLKNTSTAGVQDGFIQREGKLEMTDNYWKLTVNRETLDVLLDHIPWSFRMVKLPWMETVIHVNW